MKVGKPDDERLIQIVDAALADAAARSGRHLACRPGCSQCCTGTFAINALDVQRLRRGFLQLEHSDPVRAQNLKNRITQAILQNAADFPGDRSNGILGRSEEQRALFVDFLNEEVCPVLDPATQTCDLYANRPMTCRVFGPPVRSLVTPGSSVEEGFAVCELCFVDATDEQILACEMRPDPDELEQQLLSELGNSHDLFSQDAETTVSFAFAEWWNRRG